MAPVSVKCQWCSAVNCSNSRPKRPDLSFFRFPKDPGRARRWVINCRRADLDGKPADALHKGNVMCEEHVEASCFSTKAVHNKRLTKLAVPTIFSVPNPPTKMTPSRPPPKTRDPPMLNNTVSSPVVTEIITHTDQPSNLENTKQEMTFLRRRLKAERTRTWRLRKRLNAKQKCEDRVPVHENDPDVIQNLRVMLSKFLSPPALEFVMTQVRVSNVCVKGRRWTNTDKRYALSIYHASRKAYKLLQKLFKLPSPQTLSKAMKNLHIKAGICSNLMQLFQIKVAAMTPQERICAIILDEMALKSSLQYNPLDDEVEGFEDYGHLGRSQKPANQALLFMVRGISAKWKQPIAYMLSSGPVKATLLLHLLMETIRNVISLGLVPKLVICDQGSNNRAMFKSLQVTQQKPYFTYDNNKIFTLYDPPHLLKSIRNNFKLYGFTVDGRHISWQHIVKFYEADSKLPIRMAPKLTARHISMPPFSHLRVSLAAQVLSHSVAAGMTAMATLGGLEPEAVHTAQFIENIDQLFNCFNSGSLKSKNVMGHAMSPTSTHIAFLEQKRDWLEKVKCNNSSGSLPCIDGWKLAITCLMQFWEEMRTNYAFHFLLTDRLNQDCNENMFSIIRGKGGHRYNPDPYQFRASLRQAMVDLLMTTSNRQNCKDDLDTFLFSLDNIASKGANITIKTRLQQDVPKRIQKLMVPSAMPSLTLAESNIITYIAGYVVTKLTPLVCPACVDLVVGVKDPASDKQIFVDAKGFQGCKNGGLQVPSPVLLSAMEAMEETFRHIIPDSLHITGLRAMLIRQLVVTENVDRLVCTSEHGCDLQFYVVNLFANIRLHHHIREKNEKVATEKKGEKRQRKAVVFSHQ